MIKQLVLQLLEITKINDLFRFIYSKKAIILWYHGICDDDFKLLKGYDERHIPKSLFKKQLLYLIKNKYQFATLSELVDLIKDKKETSKIVVLTFDDGFRNVIENAYPIMKELKAKGCLYIVSNLISNQNLLWTDIIEIFIRNNESKMFEFSFEGEMLNYQLNSKASLENTIKDIKSKLRSIPDAKRKEYLNQFDSYKTNLKGTPKEFLLANWQQIQSLDSRILEIGSHTKNHPNCANLTSEEEFECELKGSKEDIENRIGYPIHHFCYPAGSYNNCVIKYVKKYKYFSATTIVPGFNDISTNLYELRRISTNENIWHFKAMISGSYSFISELLQRCKGKR